MAQYYNFFKDDIKHILSANKDFQYFTLTDDGMLLIDLKINSKTNKTIIMHFDTQKDAQDWLSMHFDNYTPYYDYIEN